MDYRVFRWYGVSELETLSKQFRETLAAWGHDWGVSVSQSTNQPTIHIRQGEQLSAYGALLESATDRASTNSEAYGSSAFQVLMRVDSQQVFLEELSGLTFSLQATGCPLSGELIRESTEDFIKRFNVSIDDPASIDGRVHARASGWLLVEVSWQALTFFVLLSPPVAMQLLPRGSGTKPMLDRSNSAISSFERLSACVKAELTGTSLSIGELSSLVVGDIIRLDHRVDEPVLVKTKEGVTLFKATLGKQSERRALQIYSADKN